MKPPLRIAVLECDTPQPATKAEYGSYGGLFKKLLQAGADALGQPDFISSKHGLDITKWDVEHEELYPNLDDIDAVLITGSRHNSFDNAPWIVKLVDYIKIVLDHDHVRVIGVCFGHQIVGRAMGVKVDRSDAGWEASVLPVSLTALGKELFGVQSLSLQQMHKDIVYHLPESTELLGFSPKCEIQGMYRKGQLITVQGHPEFTEPVVSEILHVRHRQGIFTDEMFKDCMSRVGKRHDGVVISKAFLRFLLDN